MIPLEKMRRNRINLWDRSSRTWIPFVWEHVPFVMLVRLAFSWCVVYYFNGPIALVMIVFWFQVLVDFKCLFSAFCLGAGEGCNWFLFFSWCLRLLIVCLFVCLFYELNIYEVLEKGLCSLLAVVCLLFWYSIQSLQIPVSNWSKLLRSCPFLIQYNKKTWYYYIQCPEKHVTHFY